MDKKRISITFLIVLTNTIGATAILPMLARYVEKEFGATPFQATLTIAAFYAAQFVAAPWLGKLSDRFGRRPILIISQMGTIVSYLGFMFATQLGQELEGIGLSLGISGGLVAIYLARLLDGVTGGNVSVAEAYASDISDSRSRAQALGLMGGAVGLGHFFGPALAVALSGVDLIAPIVGAAVMSGVTLLLTFILLDETLSPETRALKRTATANASASRLESRRPILLILATALVMGIYIAAVVSSLSLYAERRLFPDESAAAVVQKAGLMIMGMFIAVTFSQLVLIEPLTKKLGEQKLLVIGSFLLLASAITMAFTTLIPVVAVAILAYGFGYGLCWPSLQSLLTRFGNQDDAGRLLGVLQSAFSLALIVGPAGAGFLIQEIGPFAIFHMGSLFMGVATFLSLVIHNHLVIPDSSGDSLKREMLPEAQGFFHRMRH